jgi:hypothetical protein
MHQENSGNPARIAATDAYFNINRDIVTKVTPPPFDI